MFLLIQFTSLLVLSMLIQAKLLPVTLPFSESMRRFTLNTHVVVSPIYDTIGADLEHTRDIADHFIKYRIFISVLIASNGTEGLWHDNMGGEDNLFCFLNTFEDFDEVIYYVREKVPFFQLKAFIQFIIGKPVNNTDWVLPTLEFIWESNVLNFIVVYDINERVEVIGYNPFNKKVLNFTLNYQISPDIIFPDKLINLYGYNLTTGMIDDTPRNQIVKNELVGKDVNLIKYMSKHMNANLTINVYPNLDLVAVAILRKEVHFSYSKQFAFFRIKRIIQGSYPTHLDLIIIMVPTANLMPQFNYFFKVFDGYMWAFLFITIMFMSGINMFFAKSTNYVYYSPGESFFAMIQIFLNCPYQHIWNTVGSFRVILVTWVVFSFLVTVGFMTTLRSSLIIKKYDTEILNLDDLQDSALKVYVNYRTLPNLFENTSFPESQIINLRRTATISKLAYRLKKNASFSLPMSYVETMLTKKDSSNRFIYRIIEGYGIGGYSVYNFPKNSPFLDKLNLLNLRFEQYGISDFALIEYKVDDEDEDDGSSKTTLTVAHLQSVFTVLIIGYAICIAAFIGEVLYFKRKFGNLVSLAKRFRRN